MDWNLADVFETVVDAVPDREALVCGERRLTYRQLDERANRLAQHFRSAGIGAGDHVAVHLYNSTEYLETMLAAFKLRAVPINVNYRYVADELGYLFGDADISAVVHEPEFAASLDALRSQLPLLRHTLARGSEYEDALAAVPSERPDRTARSGDDVYILYTGGTTGSPKGVMWRHADIHAAAMGGAADASGAGGETADAARLAERARRGRRRILPACPFMHGTAHWTALGTLFSGGSVVVAADRQFDAGALVDLIEREQVTFLVIVGDAFARPLVDALEARADARPPSCLSVILSGGATLSPFLKDRLTALLPATIIVDGYGASETGGQGSMVTARGAPAGPPRFRVNAETAVLDDDLRPVPPGSGIVGRLARRGHIPLGYYKDADKTAATFPTAEGVRWSVPGDLAEVATDGTIVLRGRDGVSINTGGEKVFPDEVETVLKAHPDVVDAVVVGVPDARWGEHVAGVVQLRQAGGARHVDCAAILDHCRASLAAYKVPRSLVVVDQVERSAAGKPDYRWARLRATGPS